MAQAGPQYAPLIDGDNTARTWWRRAGLKIGLAITAVVSIKIAGFFLMSSPDAGERLDATSMAENSASVGQILKRYPKPSSIKELNEFLASLPAHESEDLVCQHVKPYTKHLFHNFLQHFGNTAPHYKTEKTLDRRHKLEDDHEFAYRFGVFEEGLRNIIRLNNHEARHSERLDRAVFGVTKFADWTWAEFQTLLKRPAHKLNTTQISKVNKDSKSKARGLFIPPCAKNWVKLFPGLFKPRQQGSCGSSYAHAAAETMRAVTAIKYFSDPGVLSAQYIVDCEGNGCSGGDAGNTVDWIARKGGIPTKAGYGSYADGKQECNEDAPFAVTTMGALHYHDEWGVAKQLCGHGPLSMRVNANDAWQYYAGGVLSLASCPDHEGVNHDTQVVAVLRSKNAFMIRNSWGADWGVSPIHFKYEEDQSGFILLEFGQNTCDLTNSCSFPSHTQLLNKPCDSADTGGTCSFLNCYKTRGQVECLNGKCICKPGYCAVHGACKQLLNQSCDLDTRGTCSVFNCHHSRGQAKCLHGRCICKPGSCAVNGACVLTQAKSKQAKSR